MTDTIDRAQDLEAKHREAALERARLRQPVNPTGLCIDCGDEISPQRLHALPGVLRCIGCQEINELER